MGSEIEAMRTIEEAVADLEPDEARRVVAWTVDYANTKLGARAAIPSAGRAEPGGGETDLSDAGGAPTFEAIGDLMEAASPNSGPEAVLVGTYWFERVQGAENVTGQQVNNALKDLGRGVSNITDAFNTLIQRKPVALARQVEKAGRSRQSRKRYKLTKAGIDEVEQMLASGNGE